MTQNLENLVQQSDDLNQKYHEKLQQGWAQIDQRKAMRQEMKNTKLILSQIAQLQVSIEKIAGHNFAFEPIPNFNL